METIFPHKHQIEFLTMAYNRFYDIYDEIMGENFYSKDSIYRLLRVKEAFAIYTELLNYEPIKWVIKEIKKTRPPMESEIGSELFKFIRNIITHFPFYDNYNDIWVNKHIINWYKDGQSIDKFLNKYVGHKEIKYRFWEADKKKMTYLSINFPTEYDETTKIYLRNFLNEVEGIKFSMILMRQIIDTQVIK